MKNRCASSEEAAHTLIIEKYLENCRHHPKSVGTYLGHLLLSHPKMYGIILMVKVNALIEDDLN
jgi:hypothetical protein